MRKLILAGIIVWCTGGVVSAQSDTGKTPKQAVLAQDAAAQSGDAKADIEFYYAADDHQRDLAKVIADGDVALAQLQKAVGQEFGAELGTAVVHAAGTVIADDIKTATEKVDGDKATIQFKGDSLPLHLTLISGNWKVSLPDMLGEATIPQVEKLTARLTEFAAEINKLTDLVSKQKFRSGEGVRDRVKDLHDRLFKPALPDAGNGQGV
jgi:hypothetical protein